MGLHETQKNSKMEGRGCLVKSHRGTEGEEGEESEERIEREGVGRRGGG